MFDTIIIIDSAAREMKLSRDILEIPVNNLEKELLVDAFKDSVPFIYGTISGDYRMIVVENDTDNKACIVVRDDVKSYQPQKIGTISFINDKNTINIKLDEKESNSISRVTGIGMV